MLSKEETLNRAKIKHKGLYKYPNWNYIGMPYPVKIECEKHGEFEQLALNHIHHGKGCLICSGRNKKTFEEHTEDCRIKHNNLYTYPCNQIIKNNKSKINILCEKHGIFIQTIDKHKGGTRCPKCFGGVLIKEEEFIKKSKLKHPNILQHHNVKYINSQTPVILTCIKHGDFSQLPNDNLQGRGCPKCVHHISKPEIQIQDFLKNLNIEIQTNKRGIIGRKELDIYIPSLKKAIEFNGRYWHYSKKYFIPGKHSEKSNLCREKGIQLLHIREDLWKKDPEKMKLIIEKFINKN